jgi:hypothetical protein
VILALTACGAAAAAGSGPAAKPVLSRPAGCSPKAPARIRRNPWSATRAQLAPPGASAIRLCRYSAIPSHLVRSTLIGAHRPVSSLVRQFDRLPATKGTFACPVDDGSQIVALLSYPSGHRVAIDVHLKGCNEVTNGDLFRAALGRPGQPGPVLLARLERLTS